MTFKEITNIVDTIGVNDSDIYLSFNNQQCWFQDNLASTFSRVFMIGVNPSTGEIEGFFRHNSQLIDVRFNKEKERWEQYGESFDISKHYNAKNALLAEGLQAATR